MTGEGESEIDAVRAAEHATGWSGEEEEGASRVRTGGAAEDAKLVARGETEHSWCGV